MKVAAGRVFFMLWVSKAAANKKGIKQHDTEEGFVPRDEIPKHHWFLISCLLSFHVSLDGVVKSP